MIERLPDYEAVWIDGMGAGLTRKINTLVAERREHGWKLFSLQLADRHEAKGAMVVFEKP